MHMNEIQPSPTVHPVLVPAHEGGPVVRESEIYFGTIKGFSALNMESRSS